MPGEGDLHPGRRRRGPCRCPLGRSGTGLRAAYRHLATSRTQRLDRAARRTDALSVQLASDPTGRLPRDSPNHSLARQLDYIFSLRIIGSAGGVSLRLRRMLTTVALVWGLLMAQE